MAWRVSALVLGLGFCAVTVLSGRERKEPPFPLNLFAKAKKEDYIGEKECARCHKPYFASYERSPHALYMRDTKAPLDRQGCEGCHGPGEIHLEEVEDATKVVRYRKSKPEEIARACLRCHGDTMRLAQWHRTDHAKSDVSCTSCHQIHPSLEEQRVGKAPLPGSAPWVAERVPIAGLLTSDQVRLCGGCHQRAVNQMRLPFHHPVLQGRMVCTDCHDVHPSKSGRKKAHPFKSTCLTCHAEKTGPFVFEHDPVAGWSGEGCTECHQPHGAPHPSLVKAFSRGLCNQCHTDKGNAHFPGWTCWQAGCHVAVHGSNSDPFLRTP